MPDSPLMIVVGLVVGLIILIFGAVLATFFNLWLQALLSGASVSFSRLIGMRLRRVRPQTIVYSRINSVKAGLTISNDDDDNPMAGISLSGIGMLPEVVCDPCNIGCQRSLRYRALSSHFAASFGAVRTPRHLCDGHRWGSAVAASKRSDRRAR